MNKLHTSNLSVFLLFLILIPTIVAGQNQFTSTILDSISREPLAGATMVLKGTTTGATTDRDGMATLTGIPDGKHNLVVSFIGYKTIELTLDFPFHQLEPVKIFLAPEQSHLDEIVIEATRVNRSVANLPTRTEVLTDEIDEAASMEPGRIAHLLTHSTGIQVQTTSASSNGAVIRIQGLNGHYTQLLKDGFPLYGGFSGTLDVLQIPPLDLRQVEYVKGSASTLYGGGAIGGLINLLTKKATHDETLLHLNFSHIGSKDFNAFTSRRFGKLGFTNLASLHLHSPYDADNDGYSDVPEVAKFNFNPKVYFNPDTKTEIYLGATIARETRLGGDMRLIDGHQSDSIHYFLDRQNSGRYTTQFSAKRSVTKAGTITLKNSLSIFDRFIHILENAAGSNARFTGKQLNTFTELNYNRSKDKHNLNVGLNVYTDHFGETLLDSNQLRDQDYLTGGIYINHLWDVSDQFILESGLRTDVVQAKSRLSKNPGEAFLLPRLSALYKLNSAFSLRIGSGMGYRMPTLFNEEAEPYGFKNVQPLDFSNVKAERSYGSNFDFKYQTGFGSKNNLFTVNQMFFYNLIDNPILLEADSSGKLLYNNTGDFIHSRGFETQVKFSFWKFTWFVGYTYTDAFLQNGNAVKDLILTPEHSLKGDLLFIEENKWRIGIDYEYKSEQVLSTGLKTRTLFSTGIIAERTIHNFVLFLNAENFTDTRQTKYENIKSGPYNTPQFTDVWAPLDGFFFNAGIKIKL